jgi:hypothetical protein
MWERDEQSCSSPSSVGPAPPNFQGSDSLDKGAAHRSLLLAQHKWTRKKRFWAEAVVYFTFKVKVEELSNDRRSISSSSSDLHRVFKKNFAMVFQILLCSECYENVYT